MRYLCIFLIVYLSWMFGRTVKTVAGHSAASGKHEVTKEELKRISEIFKSFGSLTTTTTAPSDEDHIGECVTSAGQDGVCVPFYQCNETTGTVIRDGSPVIDVRFGALNCPSYLDMCCLLGQTGPKPPPPRQLQNKPCGWSNPGAQAFRIVSNESAEFGEFPWMVAILKRTDSAAESWQGDYLGGGSIIHPSVVLTAAHKVDGKTKNEIKCRAGEWDTQTVKEMYPYQERNVKKIIRHEEFSRPALANNIALLLLEAPYELQNAPHMGVACLAPRLPPAGTRCHSMGWGKQFFDSKQYSVVLKKVELPMVSHAECQKELRKTRLGRFFLLGSSLTCAGGEVGRDTCQGDGGSPLVCPIEETLSGERFAVTALVAGGLGCGRPVPGIYVDVPQFYEWIGDHMRREGYGTSSYTYED